MTQPLVSILIPCYNAARWLRASLDSALSQTYPNTEIIFVNDGSSDNSLAIAQSYASTNLHIVSQANAGQCSACNHALRLAKGSLIKFFDADDLLSPDMLERQVAALANHPGCVGYGEWARFHTDPSEASFATQHGWRDAAPIDWLVETWEDAEPMMQCAQFLIPRTLLEQTGGWDERLSLLNDFEFFTRVILASKGVVFTPGARLYYRSGLHGSLSKQITQKAWQSAFDSLSTGVAHLLAQENSPRTRRVGANILQGLVFSMYPNMPKLTAELESEIKQLGGSHLSPKGGKGFHICRRVFGWKISRQLQARFGKHPVTP